MPCYGVKKKTTGVHQGWDPAKSLRSERSDSGLFFFFWSRDLSDLSLTWRCIVCSCLFLHLQLLLHAGHSYGSIFQTIFKTNLQICIFYLCMHKLWLWNTNTPHSMLPPPNTDWRVSAQGIVDANAKGIVIPFVFLAGSIHNAINSYCYIDVMVVTRMTCKMQLQINFAFSFEIWLTLCVPVNCNTWFAFSFELYYNLCVRK